MATGDRSAVTKINKEKYAAKCKKQLAKRKAWRIKKYGKDFPSELKRGTLKLFVKWGHRVEECKQALSSKRYKDAEKRPRRGK